MRATGAAEVTVIRFEPLDTLFFRDGRPYNQGEQNQAGVDGLFPPAPSTLVGAVRAACARIMGWERGVWSVEISAQLGDGNDLGPLRFRGPVVLRNGESVFPAPANLMAKPTATMESAPPTLLAPADIGTACDLGNGARLPVADSATEGAKPLGERGWWITSRGLEALLGGRSPDPACLVHRRELWEREARVGIARSETTRTTGENAMYSPGHVRLARGVALAMEAQRLPLECIEALRCRPWPVGGEARTCWLYPDEDPLPLPSPPALVAADRRLRYAVTVLTPADTGAPPRPGERGYAGLPGRVASACLPRPTLIGGWDSRTMEPLALRPHLPAGSVLFLEATSDAVGEVEALHGAGIGKRAAWGFGLVAVGLWSHHSDRAMERPQ